MLLFVIDNQISVKDRYHVISVTSEPERQYLMLSVHQVLVINVHTVCVMSDYVKLCSLLHKYVEIVSKCESLDFLHLCINIIV